MADPTMFEGVGVNGTENPAVGSSKRDAFSSDTAHGGLAGNQRVSPGLLTPRVLPRSPAGGAPLHQDNFSAGHKWTETDGKLHDGTGPSNLPW